MEIESASGLYFSAATQAAVAQAQKAEKDKDAQKAEKTKKKVFSNALEKAREEIALQKEGFPKEIAGMDTEEAAIYLKDEADMAGDRLKDNQTPEEFASYRKKVSQFLRFVEKNSYDVKKKERRVRTKSRKPQYTIVVINEKLDEMAKWLLSSHRDAFKLLARVDEIKGMLVDLMAS